MASFDGTRTLCSKLHASLINWQHDIINYHCIKNNWIRASCHKWNKCIGSTTIYYFLYHSTPFWNAWTLHNTQLTLNISTFERNTEKDKQNRKRNTNLPIINRTTIFSHIMANSLIFGTLFYNKTIHSLTHPSTNWSIDK